MATGGQPQNLIHISLQILQLLLLHKRLTLVKLPRISLVRILRAWSV
jgi:hypothetical protein